MAINPAKEIDSGNLESTPALTFWLNHLKKSLDEINQFVIYFESRNRDFRRRGYKGEDELQEDLESWRMVYSELNLDDRLNEAGVPILKQLQDVRELLLKNNKQSAMAILTDLPSRDIPRFQKILCELRLKVVDSISRFKSEQELFNMIIEAQNDWISIKEKEIEDIDPRKAAIISELTSDKNEKMSNWERFSHLVDREIRLHSEIAKENKIKAIVSAVTHMLTFLVTSMEELLFKISDNVYLQTVKQCKVCKRIKDRINEGELCIEAEILLDKAILEWELFTPRKDFIGEQNN